MKTAVFMRFVFGMLAVLMLFGLAQGVALAQTAQAAAPQAAPAAPPPEKVKQLLDLLNDPEVKSWLELRPAAPPPTPELEDTSAETSALNQVEGLVRNHVALLRTGVASLPHDFANAYSVVRTEIAPRPGGLFLILAVLLAVGYGAEWLFRRLLARARARGAQEGAAEQPMRLFAELVPLGVFALASVGLFLAFDWPPLMRKVVLTVLAAVILYRLIVTVTRFLLAPNRPQAERIVDVDDEESRFWLGIVEKAAAVVLAGWGVASLMPALGFARGSTLLVAYVFGLGLLALGIQCVWKQPHARAAVSPMRGWLVSFYLLVLWLIWVGGGTGLLWIGLYALLLPTVIGGVGRIADRLATRNGTKTLTGILTRVMIVRGARTLVIALAVAWLAYVWRINAAMIGESETVRRLVGGLLNGVIILVIADLFWHLSKAFIEHRLELAAIEGGTPEEMARRGRLRTLLPIFRNVLAVFIAVVAVLTILSGLGVAIGPLVAGAGIFGVAIGFGSQTLVKDVISGVFYMLDDAFRVGEYIQSGSYKGTVEGFSLRSVRLRHQRGPVFTVPFGVLGAVQNMSRDWVIEKMTITVTYDSDVEKARKIVKKIGQDSANDPEFAASTLQPLKMQGVDSFGDSGIILRMKLMTKPGEQFGIKRKALVLIKQAFDENGIKLATPTVVVSGGGDDVAGAAADALRRQQKAAELAAANSA